MKSFEYPIPEREYDSIVAIMIFSEDCVMSLMYVWDYDDFR